MYSNYLKKELDIEIAESKKFNVINYDELLKILYHSEELKNFKERYIQYDTDTANDAFAFECILVDTKNHKEYRGCGESNEKNLITKISKQYPLFMARKRALSAAMINLLDFSSKCYTNQQILDYAMIDNDDEKEKKPSAFIEDFDDLIKADNKKLDNAAECNIKKNDDPVLEEFSSNITNMNSSQSLIKSKKINPFDELEDLMAQDII